MKRYRGIEGLRAWLAWTVVAAHILQLSGATDALPHLGIIVLLSNWAVNVFIIISGFVITNLILEKHEPYGQYIIRRFFRIYPAYLVCLILGIFVTRFGLEVIVSHPWPPAVTAPISAAGQEFFSSQLREMNSNRLPLHILLHLLLLQGVVPDNILNVSAYTLLHPAWSLSLEWQFYLVAPALIALCERSRWGLVVAITWISLAVISRGTFGSYSVGFLPMMGPLFLAGIATRFFIDKLPRLRTYPTIVVLSVGGIAFNWATYIGVPYAIWVAMICYLICDDAALARPTFALRTIHKLLDGRLANAAGERSYSVYIFHWVAVCVALYMAVRILGLAAWPMLLAVSTVTILLTVVGSELLYRLIEKPGMALGRKLGRSTAKAFA